MLRRLLLRLGLSAALLAVLTLVVDVDAVVATLRGVSLWLVLPAILLLVGYSATGAWRFRVVVHTLALGQIGFGASLRLTLFTAFASVVVPLSASADAVRVGYLWRRMAIPTGAAIECVIVDRMVGLVMLAVLAAPGLLPQVLSGLEDRAALAQILLLGGLAVALAVAIAVALRLPSFAPRLAVLALTVGRFGLVVARPWGFAVQLAIAATSVVAFGLAVWLIAFGLKMPLPLWLAVAAAPMIIIAQNLPLSYFGWGIREAAVVLTLGSTSYMTVDQAVVLSVLLGIALMLAALPGAVAYVGVRRQSQRSLSLGSEGSIEVSDDA